MSPSLDTAASSDRTGLKIVGSGWKLVDLPLVAVVCFYTPSEGISSCASRDIKLKHLVLL
jgi:hypothetical protein